MLGKIVDEKQKNWDVHVAYVMTAYNATVHSALGFTLNRLVFGREMRYPNELMYLGVEDKSMDEKSYSDFVEDQKRNFPDVFDRARESLGFNAERSKKRYDMRVRPNVYVVGDWVYYFCPRHRVGRSPKWQNFYSGPYLIVEILGMVNVRIQQTAKASAMVVHVGKIMVCRGETPASWMGEIEERLIDRIERGAFISLFDETIGDGDAEIINDIENNMEEENRRNRPGRNAPMPARYIQRIYAIENMNNVDVCYRDDFQEVEGFGADEVLSKGDDVKSVKGDADERDQIEVAGRMFRAAKLQLPLAGELGVPIGKMWGALRGMWIEAIHRVYGIDREQKVPMEPLPGKKFGGGPGPIGKPKGGSRDKKDGEVEATERDGKAQGSARDERGSAGKRGGGDCYRHGLFLGDMLPGQMLRMKRGMGGMAALAAVIPVESDEDDADLADDVYAFIRRTPLPWTQARMMQVALAEFRGVDRDTLRATIAGVLTGMRKTAQQILIAIIGNGTPHRGGQAATIYLDTDTVEIYI